MEPLQKGITVLTYNQHDKYFGRLYKYHSLLDKCILVELTNKGMNLVDGSRV